MQMLPLLGICVPTYNRPNELKQSLVEFVRQIRKEREKVPIYVSDQTKSDEVKEVVNDIKKEYKLIFYKRSHTKGYAPNALSAVMMCNAEYLWLFGDDDIISPRAIHKILSELKQGFYFLQINNQQYEKDLRKKISSPAINAEERKVSAKEALAQAQDGYAGFQAEIITKTAALKKELSKLNLNDPSKLDFIHTTLFYSAIRDRVGKFIKRPLIKYRTGGSLNGREIEIWLRSYPRSLEPLRKYYGAEVIKKAVHRDDLYKMIALSKRDYPKNIKENMSIVYGSGYIGLKDKAITTLISIIPSRLIKLL